MNDVALYIFRQELKGGQNQYTFVLQEPGQPPVIGNRTVAEKAWKAVIDCYAEISIAVQAFVGHNDGWTYKESVAGLVDKLSRIIRGGLWPKTSEEEGRAFASRFAEIEKKAALSSERYHLLMATNDSKIPWWVARAGPPNEKLLICEVFGLGMISLRTNQPNPTRSHPPIALRVITCPTRELAISSHVTEVGLERELVDELERTEVANCVLLSGRRKAAGSEGLEEEEVCKAFTEGRVVLYHGHFNLSGEEQGRIEDSTIEVATDPAGDRNLADPIKIKTLANGGGLKNKDIIFIGCETAGMHPNVDETLGEYLARHDSTLVGTLYPILDDQARTFANELSKALFRDFLSWGQSVRKAREAAKDDGSLFYRAAYCYFGVPWQMSPLFEARKNLHVLVPSYLKSVYELVRPKNVYSSVLQEDFSPSARLEAAVRDYDDPLKQDPEALFIAALPSIFVAELLQESDEWVVLGPMVASEGDVRVVATQAEMDFKQPNAWRGTKIVFKGPLTASAFLEVLLHKWSITTEKIQWKTISTDCAPVIKAGLADIGLIVAREDLSEGQGFPGYSSLSVDSELAEQFYDGVPIPRILWITKRTCTEGWRRYYIIEFFKRLCERIGDDNRIDERAVPGSEVSSKIRLYRMDDELEIKQARETLRSFLTDWAKLDVEKKRRPIPDECFYDLSRPDPVRARPDPVRARQPNMNPTTKRFRVALSFPRGQRDYVEKVAKTLAEHFGEERVLYDRFHTAEFADANLAFNLPDLYRKESDLIVAVLCGEYVDREWCGLEWRAIYSHIKDGNSQQVMLFRADDAEVRGLYGLEGFAPTAAFSPDEAVTLILQRLARNEDRPRDFYLDAQ